jgi:hypothetical protein
MSKHLAVCVNTPKGRCGFVISASTWEKCEETADRMSNRVGYVGADTFIEALKKAAEMERGEYKKPNLEQYRRVRA